MNEMNFKNRGEQVFETLKREILDLKLEPGRMISENEICERFGVSRTPVRDALRLLQEQGFVETVPYRGTYVTLLSLDNIKQMIYMRVAVETMVLRDFLKVQNPMTLEEIRHAIAMQKALIQTPGFEPAQAETVGYASGTAASLYPFQDVGFYNRDRFYPDHRRA